MADPTRDDRDLPTCGASAGRSVADLDHQGTGEGAGGTAEGAGGTAGERRLIESDLLVEDVSIDGMCGVY